MVYDKEYNKSCCLPSTESNDHEGDMYQIEDKDNDNYDDEKYIRVVPANSLNHLKNIMQVQLNVMDNKMYKLKSAVVVLMTQQNLY